MAFSLRPARPALHQGPARRHGQARAAPRTRASVDAQAPEGATKTSSGAPLAANGAATQSKPASEVAQESGNTLAWAARDASGVLSPYKFDRRPVGEHDVRIQVVACGICHTDLHQIRSEWDIPSHYPMVPGHEIAGTVTEVGSAVTSFKVGDPAGVGFYCRACEACGDCGAGASQLCEKMVTTYNGEDWGDQGRVTQGGFADNLVIAAEYAVHIPKSLPLLAAAPLLCAGITVWSPMQYYGLNKAGMKLGVVGLGGLGHLAVKIGKALGMEVTVISTSPAKEKEARELLGADDFIVSKDPADVQAHAKSLDGILDTVSAPHPLSTAMSLLRNSGKLVLLGLPPKGFAYQVDPTNLVFGRKLIGGSLIGSVRETQEMIDFCGQHGITGEIEVIPMDYVNTAMERLVKNDVRYRFSIDVAGSLR